MGAGLRLNIGLVPYDRQRAQPGLSGTCWMITETCYSWQEEEGNRRGKETTLQSSPFMWTLDRIWFKRGQGCISQSWRWSASRWKLQHTTQEGLLGLMYSYFHNEVYRGDTKDWGRFAETQLQATCEKWRQEKRKQITASSVQKIISLNKISSKGKEMLYSSFEATMQQIRTYQWEWNEESVCWENAGNPP